MKKVKESQRIALPSFVVVCLFFFFFFVQSLPLSVLFVVLRSISCYVWQFGNVYIHTRNKQKKGKTR